MTKKKQQILQEALELFANEGYQNTSTSRIACQAGVSEGLIFKHFKSKEGLLGAVANLANEDIKAFIGRMERLDDPQEVIKAVFDFPPLVSSNRSFWKLQFSLKYQCPAKRQLHEKYELLETVKDRLEEAFTALNYENPEMETQLLMNIIGDLCRENTNSEGGCEEEYINFVKQKYGL